MLRAILSSVIKNNRTVSKKYHFCFLNRHLFYLVQSKIKNVLPEMHFLSYLIHTLLQAKVLFGLSSTGKILFFCKSQMNKFKILQINTQC